MDHAAGRELKGCQSGRHHIPARERCVLARQRTVLKSHHRFKEKRFDASHHREAAFLDMHERAESPEKRAIEYLDGEIECVYSVPMSYEPGSKTFALLV